ncbi:hypothetical protein WHZ78_15595 [Bradyrhizobium symbiodeficiens]|uniref:hypothetical protein n=1 Tax=Bradyrhizobium symbiodeficiens TaxID=1404367 RepID=UPI0030CCC276
MKKMTKQQYLKPNTAVRAPAPSGEVWTPPQPSKGERTFKLTSKGSVRGFVVIDGVRLNFESRAEYRAFVVIRSRLDTLRLVEQSPRVEYVDANGRVRTHVFDLKVFRRDGSVVAVDVKPFAKVKSSGIRATHALIAGQISPKIANRLLVFTERMYTPSDFYNAELMLGVARQHCPEDDEAILKLIAQMKGPMKIGDLVAKSRLEGYAFNAVVRAIAAGRLVMTERRRIDYGAVVVPAPLH